MATKNLYTEIVYNFSDTRSISKALDLFGISDSSKHVLVIIPNPSAHDLHTIQSAIQGTYLSDVSQNLAQLSDHHKICDIYAISQKELNASTLTNAVLTRMACRDF